MLKSKRVLFITQRITPYVDENSFSLLGRKVPQFVQDNGREIRTFMPKWGTINERRSQLHEVIRLSGMNLIIDDTDHLLILKVASIPSARMQVYFIDNDDYFQKRLEACDEEGVEYDDNAERAVFYARGVLETVKKLRWVPEIIHCQGWISTIAPLYVKTSYREEPSFRDSRIVFTPGGDDLTKPLSEQFFNSIMFKNVTPENLKDFPEHPTARDLNKLALNYSDGLLLTPETHDDELIAYAESLNLPILDNMDIMAEGANQQILEFFDGVWSQGKAPEES